MNPPQGKETGTGAVNAGYKPVPTMYPYEFLMPQQTNLSEGRNSMFQGMNPLYSQMPYMSLMSLWGSGGMYPAPMGQGWINHKMLWSDAEGKTNFPFPSLIQQSLRVNSQERRPKGVPEVINLESDEEQEKKEKPIVVSNVTTNNPILKAN